MPVAFASVLFGRLKGCAGGFRQRLVGHDANGTGQILSQMMEEEELAIDRNTGLASNQFAQGTFR
jgi:hypothetical protein